MITIDKNNRCQMLSNAMSRRATAGTQGTAIIEGFGMITETLTWNEVTERLPDNDRTVLVDEKPRGGAR